MDPPNCLQDHSSPDQRKRFDLAFLWQKALQLNASDPRDSCIYHPQDNSDRLTLTVAACYHYAQSAWVPYSKQDVYDRMILWRVPLVALTATTTLPALGLPAKIFTIVHLIADPIDTIYSLCYKLDLARRQTNWAAKKDNDRDKFRLFSFSSEELSIPDQGLGIQGEEPIFKPILKKSRTAVFNELSPMTASQAFDRRKNGDEGMKEFDLDVIALIVNAYQEWHMGHEAKLALEHAFDPKLWNYEVRSAVRDSCETAAAYIAADRVSRRTPSVVATFVFFAQISAAWWKTFSSLGNHYDASDPASVGLNLTPHNIAFGTLYFWLPFTVLATMYVGSANTTNSVPRILRGWRLEVGEIFKTALAKRDAVAANSYPRAATPVHELEDRAQPQARVDSVRPPEDLAHEQNGPIAAVDQASSDAQEPVNDPRGRSSSRAHSDQLHAYNLISPPISRSRVRDSSTQPLIQTATSIEVLDSDSRLPQLPLLRHSMKRRWATGGLPTWQPDKFKDWDTESDPGDPKFVILGSLLSGIVVLVPALACVWISARTPTEGFGCRQLAQILIAATWVINHACDWLLCYWVPIRPASHSSRHDTPIDGNSDQGQQNVSIASTDKEEKKQAYRNQRYFWITLAKDTIFAGGAIATITLSGVGIFNSCECWCRWYPWNHTRYLSFPQEQFVFDLIKHRLIWEFSFVVLGVFCFELLFFGFVAWLFRHGHRVLKQRDLESVVRDSPKPKKSKKKAMVGWWHRRRSSVKSRTPTSVMEHAGQPEDVTSDEEGEMLPNQGAAFSNSFRMQKSGRFFLTRRQSAKVKTSGASGSTSQAPPQIPELFARGALQPSSTQPEQDRG